MFLTDRPELPSSQSGEMINALIADFTEVLALIKDNKDVYSLGQMRSVYATQEWKSLAEACGILPDFDKYFKHIIPPSAYQEQGDNNELDVWGMYVQRNPGIPSPQTVYDDLSTAVDWLKEVKETGKYDPVLIEGVYGSQAFCMIQGVLLTEPGRYTEVPFEKRVRHSLLPEDPIHWNEHIEDGEFTYHDIVIEDDDHDRFDYTATCHKGVRTWVGKIDYDGAAEDVKCIKFSCWKLPTEAGVLDCLASMVAAINHKHNIANLKDKNFKPWTIRRKVQALPTTDKE